MKKYHQIAAVSLVMIALSPWAFPAFAANLVSDNTVETILARQGTIQGHFSISPLCPAPTIPPSCDEAVLTQEAYRTYRLNVYRITNSGDTIFVRRIRFDNNGNYSTRLQPGMYELNLSPNSWEGTDIGSANVPATVQVSSNQTTTFNIIVDTGIR